MDFSPYLAILLCAFPVFFFWRWFYRRQLSKIRKRVLIWVSTIIASPIIYAVIVMGWFFLMEYYPNHDFDPKAWRADSDKRYEYTHDLIKSRLLIGKDRQGVEAILGKNDDTNKTVLYYYIGFRPEFADIDPSYIEVDFKNGRADSIIEHDR